MGKWEPSGETDTLALEGRPAGPRQAEDTQAARLVSPLGTLVYVIPRTVVAALLVQ